MTVLAGFDSSTYPAHGIETMDWLIHNTNLSWVGYYLAPAPNRTGASWMGHRAELTADGWTIAPIYVGEQDDPNLSHNPSACKGVTDGNSAVSLLNSEGFARGTTVYLDIETGAPLSSNLQVYIQNWCSTVAANGFTPGVYCPGSDANTVASIVPNARLWVADIGIMSAAPGTTTFSTSAPSGSGHSNATAWQYQFNYSISTPFGPYNVDIDTITVTGTTHHAPVANNDSYSTGFNTALTRTAASGLLVNDTDQDGNSLTVSSVTNPSHGTLSNVFSDGSFTYTPSSGYSGSDSFTYFVNDGTVNSATAATVSITVGGPTNHAPVANNARYSTGFNTALTRTAASGLLVNDTDQDGNSLTVSSVTNPSHGTLQAFSNGSFTYTPNSGYSGPASFTYFANDGITTSATAATVSISVGGPANHAPVANNDVYSTAFNTALTIAAAGVLANDTDQDGN